MSNYTKSTNFATKDNLSPGDPLKVVRGTEIDTEYNNIATAIATKTDNASAAITGGTITGITDLAIADGGTGASTAATALNNLLPSQTSAANKYLQSDGTNASWDAVSLSTADITGTLAVANGGTGVTSSTGTGSVVLSNSPTLVTPALGTPSALVGTNITGTASGLTAGSVTTNANLTGAVTSVGNATSLGSFTSSQLATALTDETGSGSAVFATSPTLVTPALGTPSALVGTNITGTAANFNINGTVGATTANTGNFTTLTTSSTVTLNGGTANGVAYLNGSKVLTSGSALTFNGTSFGVGSSSYGDAGSITASIGVPATTTGGLQLWSTTSATHSVQFGDGTTGSDTYRGYVEYAHNGDSMQFATAATERAKITSGGNLLVGLSSASLGTRLEVKSSNSQLAGFISSDANGTSYEVRGSSGKISHYATYATSAIDCYHAWFTTASSGAQTQAVTLDADGWLYLGTTSTSTAGNAIVAYSNTVAGQFSIGHANGTSSGNSYAGFQYNGSTIGSITQSGTTAVLYNLTSDQRLKENIQDADSASSLIDAIQVRQFNWKTDQTHQRYGFIAQELVTVAPEAVHQPNDTKEMMAVDYSKLVPMLVKEIQSLRQRLSAANL